MNEQQFLKKLEELQKIKETWLISPNDFGEDFLEELKKGNTPLAEFLNTAIKQKLGENKQNKGYLPLKKDITEILNIIITTRKFWKEVKLDEKTLSKKTKELIKQNPKQGEKVLLANRLILEDYYPKEISKCQQDDKNCRNELFEYLYYYKKKEYVRKVWAIIFKILKDKHASDDCAQETWIKVYEKLHTIKGNTMQEVFGFICKIALHTALNKFNNNRKKKEVSNSDNDFEAPRSGGDKDRKNEDQEDLCEDMENIMEGAGLNTIEKKVFSLWLKDELDYKDMEKQTGYSYSHLRVLLCRAKSKIIKFLKDNYL